MTKKAIGARFRRKEDDRFLHGRGQYIGDIRFPGMRDVAFVRSGVAHAEISSAVELSAAQRTALAANLERITGKKLDQEKLRAWMARASTTMGLGVPKSLHECPPGPRTITSKRRLPSASATIVSAPAPSSTRL